MPSPNILESLCGAGETTFLYRLFMLAARRNFSGVLSDLNGAVPFYIPLHKYSGADLPTPDKFLSPMGSDVAAEMPDGWVQRQLRGRESLVLVNGVDEIAQKADVLAWIQRLSARFPRARFVIASRPGAIPEEWPP